MAALPLTTADTNLDSATTSRLSILTGFVGKLKENAAQTFSEVSNNPYVITLPIIRPLLNTLYTCFHYISSAGQAYCRSI
jgi:16S rRNA A1518/A1519 N6-dimethyltransferase RsmA/KsgA/DIM1 with predicted DNA glycosylase/AP lyase activity